MSVHVIICYVAVFVCLHFTVIEITVIYQTDNFAL